MSVARKANDVISSLDRDDVIHALDEIDREGVPKRRKSTKFCLEHRGRHYPPKLAISYASAFRYADEPELHEGLDPSDFAGGTQSNSALTALRFAIAECKCGGTRDAARTASRDSDAPSIARVVVNGRAAFKQKKAIRCLRDVARAMNRSKAKFNILSTPGGFIEEGVSMKAQPIGWEATPAAFRSVSASALKALAPFLESLHDLDLPAEYLTLGVDVVLPNNPQEHANAQLVATIDLKSSKVIAWTGKSYPTLGEEKWLVHETDLGSHLQRIGEWRCLVLGCHDLNMFSPRSMATRDPKSSRGRRADELMRLAVEFDPEIVLQHPHNTDTPNIWMGGWAGISRSLKAKSYSSGIAYFWPGHGKTRRAPMQETLDRTKHGNVADYVWSRFGKAECVNGFEATVV
jgi:hypothetical protein